MKAFLILLLFLGLALNQFSYSQASDKDKETSVLFIGNSYTHMNKMPEIFEKIAKTKGQRVHVEMSAQSGASLRVHCDRPDMFKAIKSRNWDVVVVQGFSREFSFRPAYIDTATMPFLLRIYDSIKANHSCTQVMLYQTWGYIDGFPYREEINTYTRMTDSISKGYQYASAVLNVPIVPVGKVWQEVRFLTSKTKLYEEDGQHPTEMASYLIASTFYAAIFNESPAGDYNGKVLYSDAQKIHKSVAKVVLADPQKYKLNQGQVKVKAVTLPNAECVLYVNSNFPQATQLRWDFDDGRKSIDAKTKHYYKKADEYQVQLMVEDTCGTRYYLRYVSFEELKDPAKPEEIDLKKGNRPVKKL